jgi:hypothetical protein
MMPPQRAESLTQIGPGLTREAKQHRRASPLPNHFLWWGRASLHRNESVQRGEDCRERDSDRRHLDDLGPVHPERSIAHHYRQDTSRSLIS